MALTLAVAVSAPPSRTAQGHRAIRLTLLTRQTREKFQHLGSGLGSVAGCPSRKGSTPDPICPFLGG
jgi:hypothetical protein